METEHIDVLLRLIIAHLLADFPLQSKTMVREKRNALISGYFYLHMLIVGFTTYVLLGQWDNWQAPLIIMVIHGVIDASKAATESKMARAKNHEKWLFVIDQLLHFITLFAFWAIANQVITDWVEFKQLLNQKIFTNTGILITAIAYLTVTMPVGILIGFMTKKWREEIAEEDRLTREGDDSNGSFSEQESLKNAGTAIGMIERSLILTFVLMQQYQAIGFLIAAKSVFRFGDLKESGQRKRTEYILIGTLISFILSIFIGISTQFLLKTF